MLTFAMTGIIDSKSSVQFSTSKKYGHCFIKVNLMCPFMLSVSCGVCYTTALVVFLCFLIAIFKGCPKMKLKERFVISCKQKYIPCIDVLVTHQLNHAENIYCKKELF